MLFMTMKTNYSAHKVVCIPPITGELQSFLNDKIIDDSE